MDNFEYNAPETQPEESPIQEAPVYTPPYTPRKPSPFADSPYEFQPPVYAPPKKATKARSGGKRFLSALLVIVLVAGSCFGTATFLNNHWESKMNTMANSFQSKLDALEKAMASGSATTIIPGTTVSSAEGLTPAQVYAMKCPLCCDGPQPDLHQQLWSGRYCYLHRLRFLPYLRWLCGNKPPCN